MSSIIGEVMSELTYLEFSGISDYVKLGVIRDLVAHNKQLEAEDRAIRNLKKTETALQSFVDAFEGDFVMSKCIVDSPSKRWSPIEDLYWEAKEALEQQKD